MGGAESKPRATHFQHPSAEPPPKPSVPTPDSGDDQDQRISISNKMVERLIEDAQLAGGAEEVIRRTSTPKGDYKDNMYVEKLRCLDEKHSKRFGLTIEDVKATATRIDLRTSHVFSAEPVCEEFKEKVIACYQTTAEPAETIQCWDTIGAFSTCVHEATENRLRERTKRDEQQFARRSRHVAHAREHALKDLSPPTSAY